MSDGETIRWPERFHPAHAPVHVRNTLVIDAAPEAIWPVLIGAREWPLWYANASDVDLEDGRTELGAGARFRWTTFGVRLASVVQEFEPPHRIAWQADALGVSAYHAWVIAEQDGGASRVVTEETQHGWLARLGATFVPNRMSHWHQLWLEGLAKQTRAPPLRRSRA